ncbi:response regulator transcription factor [Glutamicibacter sp. NPDC087344]|uniref:response regulator transcription factor n=1 Tax=Glutamicibacter sp. NPDC087344 TaxID=3363994 RepID=UPI0037F45A16
MVGEIAKAVVIEYDESVRGKMTTSLRQIGYAVHEESSGQRGVALAQRVKPDLVVVGFGLPDIDGIETIRRLNANLEADILAVMDISEEIEVVLTFDAGADGYCPKPLREREFRARVDAFSRRKARINQLLSDRHGATPRVLSHGALRLDSSTWEVHLDGAPIVLTATEFTLLHVLMQVPGRVRSKKELARKVSADSDDLELGYVSDSDVRSIEVHIANLRRKLGDSARSSLWIETVRGVGYRLVNDPGSY